MPFLKIALFVFVFNAFTLNTHAQSLTPELISSEGGFLTSSSGSISYSIGEPITETFAGTTHILTQGFQQPEIVSLAGIADQEKDAALYLFPNPVKDQLMVNFIGLQFGRYVLRIFDSAGKEMERKDLLVGNELMFPISLAEYKNGMYFIEVVATDATFHRSMKVIKN